MLTCLVPSFLLIADCVVVSCSFLCPLQISIFLMGAGVASSTWKRVLYEEFDLDDNYTDATFLQSLVINAEVPQRDYWRVVNDSAAVTQQISIATLAVAIAIYLYEARITSKPGPIVCP
jgi:Phosphatidylinositol N-acetylglucosaminyltransferase